MIFDILFISGRGTTVQHNQQTVYNKQQHNNYGTVCIRLQGLLTYLWFGELVLGNFDTKATVEYCTGILDILVLLVGRRGYLLATVRSTSSYCSSS